MSGKPFGQNFNVSAMKSHGCATVIYSPHFEKVSAFLLYLYYFIFRFLDKRLLQSRGGALPERTSIKLEKKIRWKTFLFIFIWILLFNFTVCCRYVWEALRTKFHCFNSGISRMCYGDLFTPIWTSVGQALRGGGSAPWQRPRAHPETPREGKAAQQPESSFPYEKASLLEDHQEAPGG